MKLPASLRTRVVALVGLAVLPLFLLSLYSNLEFRREALAHLEGKLHNLVQTVTNDERWLVDYTRQILQIMAHANDLEQLDSPDCSGLAQRLLATQPVFNNFGAVLPNGRVVCSGTPMGNEIVNVSERGWFRESMQDKNFTRGYPVVGKISGKTGIVFGLPVITAQGDLRGAVFTNVSTAWFDRLLTSLELPYSWEAGILTREGKLLAAVPDATRVATHLVNQQELAALLGTPRATGLRTLPGPDGAEYLVRLAPLTSTQDDIWFFVAAPKEEITGRADHLFHNQLLLLLVVALAAGALGFAGLDRSILAWARSLGSAARAFGRGDLETRAMSPVAIRELAELTQSFNQMAEDIQSRQNRQNEDARHIAELNRLYSVLSAVNQCIVSADSRRSLISRICRICTENGSFTLAWIGFVDGDTQELVPIAQAGQVDFMQDGERPEGPSPAATAYHSNRLAVANDIAQTPPSRWRESALKAGFRAAVGVPLHQREQVVGVLALYAQAPGFFDQAELGLLEEIGGDISYALDRLDTEAARQVAEARLARLNAELEQRVAQRTAELSSANQDLESFSYSVSHDLRAPLRAISGFSQILLKRHSQSLSEEGQHYLDNVSRAAERMSRLIEELLRYSRLGRHGARSVPTDLGRIVANVLDNFAPRIEASQARIHLGELPVIQSDPILMEQIIGNLVDNGLTYHSPGIPPELDISASRSAGRLTLTVSDRGIGIPPEYHEKVFAVFQRLHADDEYPGTGIGLAIVRKAVQGLGGSIELESAPGQGSTFRIHLPTGAPS